MGIFNGRDATDSIVPLPYTELGRAAAAASKPVALSTEDKAVIDGLLTDTQLRATPVPVSGTIGVAGTVAVSGPLTDTQLRATAVPVSGTFWQATQPVSLASLPALATGSNVIGAVTQSGTWNVTNITGTISLPTGAATAANQATIIGHVDGIEIALAAVNASLDAIEAGAGLVTTLSALDGTHTATSSFTKLINASSTRNIAPFQNRAAIQANATDTENNAIQVVEGTFADAAAAATAWTAGRGFKLYPGQPYFPDGKEDVWIRRNGSADVAVGGHKG